MESNRLSKRFLPVLKVLLVGLLAGCCTKPLYRIPESEVPCEWHSEVPCRLITTSPENVVWWEHLNDPLLNELIVMAASQNLDLQIAASRVMQARLEAKAKSADLYPRLDGSVNYDHTYCSKNALKGIIDTLGTKSNGFRRNVDFYEVGFDAEWELDLFGLSKHEIAAMKAHTEAVEETLNSVWVTLSAEIAKNYIELRGFRERSRLLSQTSRMQEQAIELAEDLLNRGIVNESDLNRLKADLSSLQAQSALLELNGLRSIHRLSILLGYTPGELFECLSEFRPLPELPSMFSIGIPSELLQRRPDIRKAERELAAATERVGSAIANLFPRFSLRGFVGEVSTNAGSLFSPASATWFIGPQLLVPIFNSRLLMQEVDYNKIVTQEALFSYRKVVLEALEEAENAIATFKYGEERVNRLSEAYRYDKRSLMFTEELFEKGIKDFLVVVNARKNLLNAEDAMLQSRVDLLLNYISIYKALGGSWFF